MKYLALDMGNSRLKASVCEGGAVTARIAALTLERDWQPPLPDGFRTALVATGASRAALCSTRRAVTTQLRADLGRSLDKVVVAGEDLLVPMATRYENPQECGQDRLLAAYAAFARAGCACVVVDAGTAVTIDGVDGDGTFLGGIILPGLGFSYRALARSSSLPEQSQEERADAAEAVFGRSTAGSLATGFQRLSDGVARATALAVEAAGHAARAFVCGHDAHAVEEALARSGCLPPPERADDLVLEGLALAVEASARKGGLAP